MIAHHKRLGEIHAELGSIANQLGYPFNDRMATARGTITAIQTELVKRVGEAVMREQEDA